MKLKNSKAKAFLLLIILFSAIIFLLSILLQTSLIEMEHFIIDFATKHYFLIGVISLLLFIFSFAIFRAIDTEITKRAIRKNNRH